MHQRTKLTASAFGWMQRAKNNPFLCLFLFLAILFFIAWTVRIGWVSGEQLELARQHQEQGNTYRAMLGYERALHAYIPWLSSREEAANQLRSLLETLEANDNGKQALEGWRRLRGAVLSTRSMFGQPDRQWLEEANRNISRLAASTDKQGKMSRQEIEKEATRLLAESPSDVHAGWGVAQFLLLLLWIGSSIALIWNWQYWRMARRWQCAAISLSAWLSWLTALYMAG